MWLPFQMSHNLVPILLIVRLELLKELELDYETSEKEVTFTEVTVTLKLSKLKMIKHLFTIVHAPENEIKYLTKVKSVVEATAKDILTQVIQSIKG